MRMQALRNINDAIEWTISNGNVSTTFRPNCKDDPDKPCYERCNSFSSCVQCAIDDLGGFAFLCGAPAPQPALFLGCATVVVGPCAIKFLFD